MLFNGLDAILAPARHLIHPRVHIRSYHSPQGTYSIMPLTPGYISELDDAVGSIISKLKGAGVYEDTVVVFSSDNGAMHSPHH